MIRALFSLAIIAFIPIGAASAQTMAPKPLVEEFQAALIETMKKAESGAAVTDRYDALLPAITKAFHLPLMTRIVVGSAWDTANQNERRQVVAAFRRLNVLTLASLLSGYSNERFETVGTSPGPQNTKVVTTKIHTGPNEFHELSYVVHEIQGRRWIIDVIVDGGISELTTRRSEYNRTLAKGGMSALIEALTDRANTISKGE